MAVIKDSSFRPAAPGGLTSTPNKRHHQQPPPERISLSGSLPLHTSSCADLGPESAASGRPWKKARRDYDIENLFAPSSRTGVLGDQVHRFGLPNPSPLPSLPFSIYSVLPPLAPPPLWLSHHDTTSTTSAALPPAPFEVPRIVSSAHINNLVAEYANGGVGFDEQGALEQGNETQQRNERWTGVFPEEVSSSGRLEQHQHPAGRVCGGGGASDRTLESAPGHRSHLDVVPSPYHAADVLDMQCRLGEDYEAACCPRTYDYYDALDAIPLTAQSTGDAPRVALGRFEEGRCVEEADWEDEDANRQAAMAAAGSLAASRGGVSGRLVLDVEVEERTLEAVEQWLVDAPEENHVDGGEPGAGLAAGLSSQPEAKGGALREGSAGGTLPEWVLAELGELTEAGIEGEGECVGCCYSPSRLVRMDSHMSSTGEPSSDRSSDPSAKLAAAAEKSTIHMANSSADPEDVCEAAGRPLPEGFGGTIVQWVPVKQQEVEESADSEDCAFGTGADVVGKEDDVAAEAADWQDLEQVLSSTASWMDGLDVEASELFLDLDAAAPLVAGMDTPASSSLPCGDV